MIASRLHQIIPHPSKPQAQINQLVVGVCDYIPYSLKFKHSLTIAIDGDPHTILNSVLWSEYFYKTMLKECQQHFFLTYASEGDNAPNALFIKNRQKIYKFQQNLTWNSLLRRDMASSLQKQEKILIQTYSKTGTMRSILIIFGQYVQGQGVDLLLKLVQSENYNIHTHPVKKTQHTQNQMRHEDSKKVITCAQEDRHSQKQEMKSSKQSEKSLSRFNSLKSKSKVSQINKENSKTSKTGTQKVMSSTKSKKVLQKKCNNTTVVCSSNRIEEAKPLRPQIFSIIQEKCLPKQSNNSRQRIISKILATKQQALILLKSKVANKQLQFEHIIKEERAQHQQEMKSITESVKSLLQQYKHTKVSQQNEIFYLNERVKTLEGALSRRQAQSEQHLLELSTLINAKREAEELLKKKSSELSKLKDQQQSQRKLLYEQNKRLSEQMQKAVQKSSDYQRKYEGLVSLMRRNLPSCEEQRGICM